MLKISPELITTTEDYIKNICGNTAGLIIGDRALEQRKVSAYRYDLGMEWKNFTGLPFVFAAWVSNKKLNSSFIENFNKANLSELEQIDKVVNENPYKPFDLEKYYTEYISYELNEEKKIAMEIFLNKIF